MTAADRQRRRREPPPRLAHEEAAKERHFAICGEVVWEWNELHRVFGYVFTHLLGETNWHVSNALWHTPTSDKAQRDLLKTAVEWADGVRKPHRERLLWAIEQADKLSTYRNDIVHGHGGLLIAEGGLTTHLATGRNSLKRVMKHAKLDTPLHELMDALCDDLRKLQHFVAEVWRRMRPGDGKPKPSPRYPVSRCLALVAEGHKRTHVPPSRKPTQASARRKRGQAPAK